MMFVAGEVAEPLSETTGLVEDIVRAQVVEMVLPRDLRTRAYSRLSRPQRKPLAGHRNLSR